MALTASTATEQATCPPSPGDLYQDHVEYAPVQLVVPQLTAQFPIAQYVIPEGRNVAYAFVLPVYQAHPAASGAASGIALDVLVGSLGRDDAGALVSLLVFAQADQFLSNWSLVAVDADTVELRADNGIGVVDIEARIEARLNRTQLEFVTL